MGFSYYRILCFVFFVFFVVYISLRLSAFA
jgi:hypothetical protein